MTTMEWMKSKAKRTVEIRDLYNIPFEIETLLFIGKLPYRMMLDVKKGFFNQTSSGSIETDNYMETLEEMHIYGNKNPKAVYSYTTYKKLK